MTSRCITPAAMAAIVLTIGWFPGPRLLAEPTEPFPGILLETDVQYATGSEVALHMDIARPKPAPSAEPAVKLPAVVFIHGGGWRGGDKSSFRTAIISYARLGYVAASVQYRLAPAHKWPAQIEDCKAAVRYLRARARELNIDPERIGAAGGSAGGHLALLLATTDGDKELEGHGGHAEFSSRIGAAASIAGPTDFAQTFPPVVEVMLKDLIGVPRDAGPAAYQKASPLHHISRGDAPILAIHGTDDELVPYAQSIALVEVCEKAGVEAKLIPIDQGRHGSGGNPQDWHAANLKMLEFFNRHLRPAGPGS
jgi:acetyl esterase/lipase